MAQEMMQIVGSFMDSAPYVKCLIFDGHGSHQFIRRTLHGDFASGGVQILPEDLQDLPCWRDVTHEALPKHALPRLPVQICKFQGQPIWGLPGPCALPNILIVHDYASL